MNENLTVNKKKIKSNPFATKDKKIKKLEDIKLDNGGLINNASNLNPNIINSNNISDNDTNYKIDKLNNSNHYELSDDHIARSLNAINNNNNTSNQSTNVS